MPFNTLQHLDSRIQQDTARQHSPLKRDHILLYSREHSSSTAGAHELEPGSQCSTAQRSESAKCFLYYILHRFSYREYCISLPLMNLFSQQSFASGFPFRIWVIRSFADLTFWCSIFPSEKQSPRARSVLWQCSSFCSELELFHKNVWILNFCQGLHLKCTVSSHFSHYPLK